MNFLPFRASKPPLRSTQGILPAKPITDTLIQPTVSVKASLYSSKLGVETLEIESKNKLVLEQARAAFKKYVRDTLGLKELDEFEGIITLVPENNGSSSDFILIKEMPEKNMILFRVSNNHLKSNREFLKTFMQKFQQEHLGNADFSLTESKQVSFSHFARIPDNPKCIEATLNERPSRFEDSYKSEQ